MCQAPAAETVWGFPGEDAQTAALRKWDGARGVKALEIQSEWEHGQDLLTQAGVGRRVGKTQRVSQEEMEPLFLALHGEGDVPDGFGAVFDDLRRLIDQESSDMLATDPSFQDVLMAHPDYFPRGWKQPRAQTGRQRIGVRPGFTKPRVDATFEEMIEAGFEPPQLEPLRHVRAAPSLRHRVPREQGAHRASEDLGSCGRYTQVPSRWVAGPRCGTRLH